MSANPNQVPDGLKYTKDHEWARFESDGTITIGITAHAQDSLGEIVFVELPATNKKLSSHETFGVVESIKAVSDLYCPIAGTVLETNQNAKETPNLINDSPYEQGWLIRIKPENKDFAGLLAPTEYKNLIQA